MIDPTYSAVKAMITMYNDTTDPTRRQVILDCITVCGYFVFAKDDGYVAVLNDSIITPESK